MERIGNVRTDICLWTLMPSARSSIERANATISSNFRRIRIRAFHVTGQDHGEVHLLYFVNELSDLCDFGRFPPFDGFSNRFG